MNLERARAAPYTRKTMATAYGSKELAALAQLIQRSRRQLKLMQYGEARAWADGLITQGSYWRRRVIAHRVLDRLLSRLPKDESYHRVGRRGKFPARLDPENVVAPKLHPSLRRDPSDLKLKKYVLLRSKFIQANAEERLCAQRLVDEIHETYRWWPMKERNALYDLMYFVKMKKFRFRLTLEGQKWEPLQIELRKECIRMDRDDFEECAVASSAAQHVHLEILEAHQTNPEAWRDPANLNGLLARITTHLREHAFGPVGEELACAKKLLEIALQFHERISNQVA